ncbi:heme peroxidase [Microdochium trichocladiopsis]|uniref:Peroxidase n=1 Tax=Microdochium trichocladiopsis TaxID=1682393 RepID=A0A9P8XVJ8_9PEZI|nr:heme peroxidase [Microdochium trichocladiopsis]KAH7020736.1 heme peroxidase [Microdochium trichocladiopsis]
MRATITSTAAMAMGAAAYVWPGQYDIVEDVYSLQAGAVRLGFIDAVNPCGFGTGRRGVQNAAEWLRVAYHDMATADVAAGTGGIDASIRYETARDENEGAAFNNTLAFFSGFYNAHVPLADLIALGVVASVDMCGGPAIEFRAGRVDATGPGATGVPKPDQDIATHTAAFARQGFSKAEMIALVACGHTLGGVHHEDFPQIVGDPDATPGNTTQFEGGDSAAIFDNQVVTEYLDGTTQNPLVVSHNATFRSDHRVFGADANATARALADPAVFRATCASVLTRMINTVPAGVVLSDPIVPIDVKPYIDTLALTANLTISFAGRIRIRLDADSSRDENDMQIDLIYTDRNNQPVSTPIPTTRLTFRGGVTTGLHGSSFAWFNFATSDLDADAGISGFKVRMTKPSTGAVTVFDNGGTEHGFPIDDSLLYQGAQSCLTTTATNTHDLTVVAAVRTDRANELLALDVNYKASRLNESFAPFLSTRSASLASTGQTVGGYTLFKTTVPMDEESWFSAEFDLALGATKVLRRDSSVLQSACKSL